MSKPTTERLAAYAEGAVDVHERAELEAALEHDVDARRSLAQVQAIHAALRAPVPELESVDMRSRIQIALQARAAQRIKPIWFGLAAAAACIGLAVWLRPLENSEFRARGASERSSATERWTGIRVYRARTKSEVTPIEAGTVLSNGDKLLFTYTNVSSAAYQHLMIFGVDVRGEVHWYYPAYDQPGTDPRSVGIERRASEVLPELILHDFAPGPVMIHGVFSRRALRVSEVEAGLRGSPDFLARLPDVFVQRFTLEAGK